MNPFDHARSSARLFGGRWEDYHPLHHWLDASKATLCHFTHRALRHHVEGIEEAVAQFGEALKNSDGAQVGVAKVGALHVEEDCRCVPRAEAWTRGFTVPAWLPALPVDAMDLAASSARRFGGEAGDYLPLHRWFLATSSWCEGPAHLLFRHHAFGLFEAEARFGPAIAHEGGGVATRVVAEQHVRTVTGRTPSASDYLRHIRGERWMVHSLSPAKAGLACEALVRR